MDRLEAHRLRWKCRRGLLELDLVLGRFLQGDSALTTDDLTRLNELLDFPDNDLWDIVIGRSEQFAPHLNEIVARLRAA
jgi:antitoxin CptB